MVITLALALLIIVSGTAGLTCIFVGGRQLLESVRAREWSKAQSLSLKVSVEGAGWTRGDQDEHGEYFRPVVIYTYRAGERVLQGSRIGFGEMKSTNKRWIERNIAWLSKGDPVVVFFDPKNPVESVLTRRPRRSTIVLIGVGLCRSICGICSR